MLRTNSAIALVAGLIATPALAQVTWTYNDIDADANLELSDVEFEGYSAGLFERYDTDADGFLSDAEFGLLDNDVGPFSSGESFETWDTERDGVLAADEFNAGLFDTYDADDDLGIDETEYAAYGMGEETVGGLDNNVTAGEIISLNEWGYDELYTDGVSVEELLDADVIDATGEDVGDVENVLFGPGGELVSVIVEVGGFWDIGDTHVNVPWSLVETAAWEDGGIMIPLTEEQLADPASYGLFNEDLGYGYGDAGPALNANLDDITDETLVASEEVGQVSGDGIGVVETGPRVWRAPDLIGDYARLRDGDSMINYGYVEDIIVRDGQIAAVLVTPDRGWGTNGDRAYPYYGAGYGWEPGRENYDLPYDRTEADQLGAFDDDRLLD